MGGHTPVLTPLPIRPVPAPEAIWLPLRHLEPQVSPGEYVRAGQLVAAAIDGSGEAPVHASLAGTVVGVRLRTVPGEAHPLPHLGIEVNRTPSPAIGLAPLDYDALTVDGFRRRLLDTGVIDPADEGNLPAARSDAPSGWVLLTAPGQGEAAPRDAALLAEQHSELIEAARWWRRGAGAEGAAIAIGQSLASAAMTLRASTAAHPDVRVLVVDDAAFALGHDMRIAASVGLGAKPTLHLDLATALAGLRSARDGEIPTHRIVSVTGEGVAQAANLRVPIGTPAHDVIAAAGGYGAFAALLIDGGAQRGQAAEDDGFAIHRHSVALTVLATHEWRGDDPAMPCIRCGDCAPACPAGLRPQRLLALLAAGETSGAIAQGLMDCTACAACDLACPSHIRLAAGFRQAQIDVHAARLQRSRAVEAGQRHHARASRLQALALLDAGQRAKRQQQAASAAQAALARARARKAPPAEGGDPGASR